MESTTESITPRKIAWEFLPKSRDEVGAFASGKNRELLETAILNDYQALKEIMTNRPAEWSAYQALLVARDQAWENYGRIYDNSTAHAKNKAEAAVDNHPFGLISQRLGHNYSILHSAIYEAKSQGKPYKEWSRESQLQIGRIMSFATTGKDYPVPDEQLVSV